MQVIKRDVSKSWESEHDTCNMNHVFKTRLRGRRLHNTIENFNLKTERNIHRSFILFRFRSHKTQIPETYLNKLQYAGRD